MSYLDLCNLAHIIISKFMTKPQGNMCSQPEQLLILTRVFLFDLLEAKKNSFQMDSGHTDLKLSLI